MIQIRSLYSGPTTAQSVKDWFKEKRKEDLPVQVEDFIKHCEVAGVNWVGLFCMAILETGYFTSHIFKTKKNMFGLGAIDSDPLGGAASFQDESAAILAGAQHLAVYAGVSGYKKKPHYEFILQRTAKIREWGYFGIVRHFSDLGGKDLKGRVKWASNPKHGEIVERLYLEIEEFSQTQNPVEEVVEKPLPSDPTDFWEKVIKLLRTIHPVLSKIHPWLGWFILILYSVLDIFF